jgi:hypothetical protein
MRIAGGGAQRGDGESPWWVPSSAGSAPLRSPARVDIPMSTLRDASVVRAEGLPFRSECEGENGRVGVRMMSGGANDE